MVTRVLTLAGALLLLSAAPAQAAIFNVTKTADTDDGVCNADCSLREAIDEANQDAATIDTVDVPGGTYTLTLGELSVTAGVTIDGPGAGSTVITAGGDSRVLRADIPGTAPKPVTTIRGVTVTGGLAEDTFEGGAGLLNANGGTMVVTSSVVTGNSLVPADNSANGGGGVSNISSGGLTIVDTTISGNRIFQEFGGFGGGGGVSNTGTGGLTVGRSTVSGNSVEYLASTGDTGGGGIYAAGSGAMTITNSTVSGNRAIVPSASTNGGGGIFYSGSFQGSELMHATLAGNSTDGEGGGVLSTIVPLLLSNSIFAGNDSDSAGTTGCGGSVQSGDFNMESPGNTCGLGSSDFPNTDPQLGPLSSNGGPTATHALAPASPAIDRIGNAVACGSEEDDQRGVLRPKGAACEIGAYEFDGLASAASRCYAGPVDVALFPPAGASSAARTRIDGGAETVTPAAGSPPTARVAVPDGSHSLEYWGDFGSQGQELLHHFTTVLVDTAAPVVSITSDQDREGYTVGERASFSVRASDQGTGLASDPTASRRPINTRTPGTRRIRRSATDNCGNVTTRELVVRVLPVPEYGKEVNLIPLAGSVTVAVARRPRGGASASQKGQTFIPLQQARQVPVGSFVNTRRGRVRLISSRAPGTRRIQAGEFSSGLFQVLQSRRRRARGLTELRLKGSSFRSCRRAGRGKRATAAASIRRRLRANARGRFRTRGRHSAATVRGTVWLTADACEGTITRVSRGRVAVRDFRRKRTILVRAGKSYLAKAPR